ncbi:MAG: response regulator transcription factor [Candidatus Omnitrophica bacterium]|nr:response regulator transcription factor [Candidatus Omnitrophota bacterium]
MKKKVVIVDDHPIVREGLKQVILQDPQLMVCGEAEDLYSALDQIEQEQPDIAIVDITLKKSSGLDLIREISAQWPKIKTLVLSIHDEAIYAERALRAGANGYVMKQQAMINILDAIHHVLHGELYVSQDVSKRLLHLFHKKPSSVENQEISLLSNRELQVFQLYGQGKKTRIIAGELNISAKTVESHREHIMEKLNLSDSSEMIFMAVQFMIKNNLL